MIYNLQFIVINELSTAFVIFLYYGISRNENIHDMLESNDPLKFKQQHNL